MKKNSLKLLILCVMMLLIKGSQFLVAQNNLKNTNTNLSENVVPLTISGKKTAYKQMTTSINSIEPKSTSVSIYPNPFTSTTRFDFGGNRAGNVYTLLIYDISGTLVKEVTNILANYYELNKENMKAQTYYYLVNDNNRKQIATGKFVITD